jgi:hypothetical protein
MDPQEPRQAAPEPVTIDPALNRMILRVDANLKQEIIVITADCYPQNKAYAGVAMVFRKRAVRSGIGCRLARRALRLPAPLPPIPGVEYENFEVPPDWNQPAEWAFARLMYPPGPNDGYAGRFDGDWRDGLSLWTQDYPRADRHFSQALRRLTRIRALRRAARQPRRRRRLRLAVALRRPGRRMGPHRRAGQGDARIPAARRLLHGRRLPRQLRVGDVRSSASSASSPIAPSSKSRIPTPSFTPSTISTTATRCPARRICAGLQEQRHRRALARHLRRPGPHHGGDLV